MVGVRGCDVKRVGGADSAERGVPVVGGGARDAAAVEARREAALLHAVRCL